MNEKTAYEHLSHKADEPLRTLYRILSKPRIHYRQLNKFINKVVGEFINEPSQDNLAIVNYTRIHVARNNFDELAWRIDKSISGTKVLSTVDKNIDNQVESKPPTTKGNQQMKNKVFISYSSKDKEVVDVLDNELSSNGLVLIKDERDVVYTHSFTEFMKTIRHADYVLMIISDSFLKSINCMFEVLEVIKDENYRSKIMPIVLHNAKISSSLEIAGYIEFWKGQYVAVDTKLRDSGSIGSEPLQNDLRKIYEIQLHLGEPRS